jgi:pSer/pThr/pTyr-binding forkhead associated (FHA) protein
MRLHIKLLDGQEMDFSVSKSSFIIGRSSQSDVQIPHEGMSRRHCLIEHKGGDQVYVTDLESINGVFIDEKRIQPGVPTALPLYLNLSFGAVQSCQIDLEERTSSFVTPSEAQAPSPHYDSQTVKKSTKADGEKRPRPRSKQEKSSNKLLLLLILGIAVAGTYYYLENKKAMEAPLTPEEMYE